MRRSRYTFLLMALISLQGTAQYELGIPHVRNYAPREYDAHNQNWSIVEDSLGVLFIGNTSGVLVYNGIEWQTLTVRNQSVVRSLCVAPGGRIYVGAKGDIGYLERDEEGGVAYVSLVDSLFPPDLKFTDVWSVEAAGESVFFSTTHSVIRYTRGAFHSWTTTGEFDVSRVVNGKLYTRDNERGVLEITGDSLVPVPGMSEIAAERLYFMIPWSGGRMMVGTRSKGLFVYDGTSLRSFAGALKDFLTEARVYHAKLLSDGTLALATLRKGLVILDSSGHLKCWMTNKSGLLDLNIRYVHEDRHGSLWLAMNNGLSCVDWSSGVTVFDDRHQLTGSIRDVRRFKGTLYVSTNQGVFYMDGRPESDPPVKFSPVDAIRNQSWLFFDLDDRLLVCTNDGLFELTGRIGRRVSRFDGYQALRLHRDPSTVLIGLRTGIGVMRLYGGKLEEVGRIDGVDLDVREIAEDEQGRVWALTTGEGAMRLRWPGAIDLHPVIDRFDTSDGLPPAWITAIQVLGRTLFGTVAGLYRFDDSTGKFVRDMTFESAVNLANLNVFLMTGDSQGRIWSRIGKRIGYFEKAENGFNWVDHALRPYRLNPIYHISSESGGPVWLGTSDGLLRYEERSDSPALIPPMARIRSVKLSYDSLVAGEIGNGSDVGSFPFSSASVRFDFSSDSYVFESETEYQYRLSGFDDAWSQWTKIKSKEYTNLPEGTYRFEVVARSVFGIAGEPSVVRFDILPPWYRTWWAYLLYVAAAAVFIVLIIRVRVAAYRKQQQVLEHRIEERTIELKNKNEELHETLTKLQAAQSQMVQSEKLMALGNLIAGVAHEINNPVTFIYSNIPHLRQYINELKELLREAESLHGEKARTDFEQMKENRDFAFLVQDLDKLIRSYENGAERITQIVGNLRRFSRSNDVQVRDVDLRESLNDTLAILTPQFKYNIDVQIDLGDLPQVECNAGEIQQVFMNILANAAYAVESRNKAASRHKGHIRVEARNIATVGQQVPWVQFAIRDDGTGMSPEVQKRLFDPFFTTKPVGQGTGLGLSISHSIIEKHGGKLYFSSREGEGTDFFIELPVRQQGQQ